MKVEFEKIVKLKILKFYRLQSSTTKSLFLGGSCIGVGKENQLDRAIDQMLQKFWSSGFKRYIGSDFSSLRKTTFKSFLCRIGSESKGSSEFSYQADNRCRTQGIISLQIIQIIIIFLYIFLNRTNSETLCNRLNEICSLEAVMES